MTMNKTQLREALNQFLDSLPDKARIRCEIEMGIHESGDPFGGFTDCSPNNTATISILINGGAQKTQDSGLVGAL